jgi:hypothetical protein
MTESEKDQLNWKLASEFMRCDNFKDLHRMGLEWLDGTRKGYHISGGYTLESLDGDPEFIDLLKYVSTGLQMVTTNSQPSVHTYQTRYDQPRYINGYPCGNMSFNEFLSKVNKFEIMFRPYIQGFVTKDTFEQIMHLDQSDLVILGVTPDNKFVTTDPTITQAATRAYIKNTHLDTEFEGFVYTKYGFHLDEDKPRYSHPTGFWYHNFNSEKGYGRWYDKMMYEICITHSEFGVDPLEFDSLIKDLCSKIQLKDFIDGEYQFTKKVIKQDVSDCSDSD